MQLCSKPGGARGIDPEIFQMKGSAFILSSDHCTQPVKTTSTYHGDQLASLWLNVRFCIRDSVLPSTHCLFLRR